MKTDRSSLLAEEGLNKSIWREAIHEQKESFEEAVLRMALNVRRDEICHIYLP